MVVIAGLTGNLLPSVFYYKCGLRSDNGSVRNLDRLTCKHVNAALKAFGDLRIV